MNVVRFVLSLLLATILCASPVAAEETAIREHELEFGNDGLELAATLFLPAGSGPFPAIAFSHGSAREHRRLPGYRGLARKIASEGLAVLLFDKRGVGDSEGEYEETPRMESAAGDLLAAVRLLRGRPEIDGARIGVFGHSQGAWIAPLAAATDEKLAFVVAISGGGVSVLDQVLFQQREELLANGVDADAATRAAAAAKPVFDYFSTGTNRDAAERALAAAHDQPWAEHLQGFWLGTRLPAHDRLQEPLFEFFRKAAYDPAATLSAIRVPVLVLLGARDVQSPAAASAQRWIEAFEGPRAGLLTLHLLGDEGHALWELTDGGPEIRAAFWVPLRAWLARRGLNGGPADCRAR